MKNLNQEIEDLLISDGIPYTDEGYAIVAIINGVKTEWNTETNCLVVGYRNSDNDKENLRKLIIANFGDKAIHSNAMATIRFCRNASVDDFEILVNLISNLPFKIEKPVGLRRGTVAFNPAGYFLKTAKAIRYAVDNEYPSMLNRGALGFDAVDTFVIMGESINRTPVNTYREHVVPCDFLIRESVEMIRAGKGDTEIAMMLKNNLVVVLITNEEALKLDSELGLKVDMPENWVIGMDPLERLYAAEIKLK